MIVELTMPFGVKTSHGKGRAIAYVLHDADLQVLVEHADGELACMPLKDLKSTSIYVTGVPFEPTAATEPNMKTVTR
jgi:hypothetical protein